MSTYNFNNHALLRVHETIKDALDPNGILAAGRAGMNSAVCRHRGVPVKSFT